MLRGLDATLLPKMKSAFFVAFNLYGPSGHDCIWHNGKHNSCCDLEKGWASAVWQCNFYESNRALGRGGSRHR